jgi:hypothetical protein
MLGFVALEGHYFDASQAKLLKKCRDFTTKDIKQGNEELSDANKWETYPGS